MGLRHACILLSLVVGGCAASNSVACEDGTTCPHNYQCDVANNRCLRPDQIAACDGIGDEAPCSLDGQPGTCRAGACEPWFCGDGRREGTEQCDGDDLGVGSDGVSPTDCTDVGYYDRPGLECDDHCNFDPGACTGGHCGDGMVNGPELCDGTTNRTCIGIGFDAGSVRCDLQCGLTIRDCSRFGWNPESLTDVIAYAVGGSGPEDQWAVGGGGKAMRFEGAFWNTVPTGLAQNLVGVSASATDDAWVVGQSDDQPALPSIVAHWDANSWTVASGVPAAEYIDVWQADRDHVFVATDRGVAAYDHGTWAMLGSLTEPLVRIHGTSATDVWVATLAGPTKRWNGSAWSTVSPPNAQIHFLAGSAASDIWVAGSNADDLGTGLVAHWDGAAWQTWRTAASIYNNIASSAPNDAWVAGTDGILRHWDGVAWSESLSIGASPSGLAAISGFTSFGPGDYVAVSTLNLAYRFRGQTFGVLPRIGPNPFDAKSNTEILKFAPNDVWVTNIAGDVQHYDGDTWTVEHTVPSGATAIAGDSAHDLWVGDSTAGVTHFDGTSWTREVVAGLIGKIDFVWAKGGEVWAFQGSVAMRRTGAGAWEAHMPMVGGKGLLAVSGSDAQHLYAIQEAAPLDTLWQWDGNAWTEVVTGSTKPIIAVLALSENDVHVAATNGRLSHFDGTGWREEVVPALADLTFLAASAHDDVIAASQRDLFHFDGVQWSMMRPPVDFVPNTPDYLPISGLAVAPGRVDILLDRYRIRTLIRTRPITCRQRETDCHDGVDDDCDGKIDAQDDQCGGP